VGRSKEEAAYIKISWKIQAKNQQDKLENSHNVTAGILWFHSIDKNYS